MQLHPSSGVKFHGEDYEPVKRKLSVKKFVITLCQKYSGDQHGSLHISLLITLVNWAPAKHNFFPLIFLICDFSCKQFFVTCMGRYMAVYTDTMCVCVCVGGGGVPKKGAFCQLDIISKHFS